MSKYTIGIDFGTLSGRAAIFDTADGREIACSVMEYAHAVIDTALPSGRALGTDWALQDPQDWLDVLQFTFRDVLDKAQIDPADIVGVGVDMTSSTVLPVTADGTPLRFLEQFQDEPQAYAKLWKHHGAEEEAAKINEVAQRRGERFLSRFGGKLTSEFTVPKVWETLRRAPEVYHSAAAFLDGGDWIVWMLTGTRTLSTDIASFKALWNRYDGLPARDFFRELDPELENFEDKYMAPLVGVGNIAGYINEAGAKLTGLLSGTPVAAAIIDAHAAVPASAVCRPGQLLGVIGTSAGLLVTSKDACPVPGICAWSEDGFLPGLCSYEAGQTCVGDHFAWVAARCTPAEYYEQAKQAGVNIHTYLTDLAAKQEPGQHGLLALDWWGGNRSVLSDYQLTGMMLGMTTQTRPEDIYHALLEATAFGVRIIVENFRNNNVPVDMFIAAGGIAFKNNLLMQIYADVLNMPVYVAQTPQSGALGSAIYAAAAVGQAAGGWDTLEEAVTHMAKLQDYVRMPNPAHVAVYEKLFAEYRTLHDYFGRGENDVMKRLRTLREQALHP